jgi:hypothetical protein
MIRSRAVPNLSFPLSSLAGSSNSSLPAATQQSCQVSPRAQPHCSPMENIVRHGRNKIEGSAHEPGTIFN